VKADQRAGGAPRAHRQLLLQRPGRSARRAARARTGMDRVFSATAAPRPTRGRSSSSRRWFYTRGDPERTDIVATWSSFHGRSMGSVAMTGTTKYWEGFGHRLSGVSHVKYGDLDAMRRRVNDRTAAVIVEPMQGEGGVMPAPPGYLQGLRALCDETGRAAHRRRDPDRRGAQRALPRVQHEGVLPDVVTLAKGLGGGVPIGAFLVRTSATPTRSPRAPTGPPSAATPSPARRPSRCWRPSTATGSSTTPRRWARGSSRSLEGLAAKYPTLVKGARGRGLLCGLVLADGVEAREVLGAMRDRGCSSPRRATGCCASRRR
jgi:acetylornithine/N-succinyldiaminopimelate aminotransferase